MIPSTSCTTGTTDYNTRSEKKRRGNDHIAISNHYQADAINQANVVAASSNIKRNTAIDEQKERSKKFWKDSNFNENIKALINDDVMNHLDQGMVLPIFHTLCRSPSKRLFPPNTRVRTEDDNCTAVIQLSSAPVKMGVCTDKNEFLALLITFGTIIVSLNIQTRNQMSNKDNLLDQTALKAMDLQNAQEYTTETT